MWYNTIWYDTISIWYNMTCYDRYDMLWRDMICINKMNGIKSWNGMSLCMFWRHYIKLYNLCMSYRTHHETILHSRHILQLTSLANICVNIAVRTISRNQTCGVLKAWLARNKLQKLRTHHANWHRIVFLSSMMLIPLYWCSTLLHSFSHALCGVSFLVEL